VQLQRACIGLDISKPQLTSCAWPGQGLHSSVLRQQVDEASPTTNPLQQVPGINPLQQTPGPGPAPAHGKLERVARAVLRGVAISPRKLNLFMRNVRRLHVDDAINQCAISVKKSARIVRGVIGSARSNAVYNHGLDASRLYVGEMVRTLHPWALTALVLWAGRAWYRARSH
jgi:Ribosomal protein L22p/L17e